jgi:hypothetical protein
MEFKRRKGGQPLLTLGNILEGQKHEEIFVTIAGMSARHCEPIFLSCFGFLKDGAQGTVSSAVNTSCRLAHRATALAAQLTDFCTSSTPDTRDISTCLSNRFVFRISITFGTVGIKTRCGLDGPGIESK